MSDIDRLADAKYLLVTTFRKNGTPVPTPVWAARDGDRLLVWTVADSGKVKRIRRDPTVRLAPCDVRGKPTGDEVAGTAEILDATGSDRARTIIGKRYGLVGKLTMLGSRVRRGRDGTVGVALTPTG